MSYVKTGLGAIISSPLRTTTATTSTTAIDPEAAAKQKLIDEWPRCKDARTGAIMQNIFLYQFADGRNICARGWREDYYQLILQGKLPTFAPPFPGKEGTRQHFTSLCKAQGPGGEGAPEELVRTGFTKAGMEWKPSKVPFKMSGTWRSAGSLKPPYDDPSRSRPRIAANKIGGCVDFLAQAPIHEDSDFNSVRRDLAYLYSIDETVQVKIDEEIAAAQEERTAEHRPEVLVARCRAAGVPDHLLECCAQAMSRRGMTPEKYLGLVNAGDPSVTACLHVADEAHRARKNRKMLMIAGALGAAAVGVTLFKKIRGGKR